MEYYLLDNYLKFQKDNSETFFKSLKRIPLKILILLVIALIFVIASIIVLIVFGMNIWFSIFTFIEMFVAIILYFVQERWEINHSRERYDDFIEASKDLYEWLSEYSINTKEEIELIKNRLQNDLKEQDKLKRQQKDKTDKWMQTLVIPLILAIITSMISNQTDIDSVITYTVTLLGILALVYAIIWIVRSVTGILNNRKRNNIKYFIDDLQGVIDEIFIFSPSVSIGEESSTIAVE